MFVILLKFSTNKDKAGQYMEGHNQWIKHGFNDGVFLLVGGLPSGAGGGLLAHNASLADIQQRVSQDPFVEHGIVTAEIIEIKPARVDERLQFLL